MRLCILLLAFLGSLSDAAFSGPTGWHFPGRSPRFDRLGDVEVAGSFSIFHFYDVTSLDFTAPPAGRPYSSVSNWGYRVAQSFVFAIEEINRSVHLLPNLTLGFSIRNSGDSVHGALHETIGFLTGQEEPVPNYFCGSGPPKVAVVGDTRSALSVSMARLLGLYKFPQISYSSTLPFLSDKTQFPSFLRTIPSDIMFTQAVTQLVLHFAWSWVGILAQDDDFGQQASSLATQELSQAGACVEFNFQVSSQTSQEKTRLVVQNMLRCTATVVLVFVNNSNFQLIMLGLLNRGIKGWVLVSPNTRHMANVLTVPGVSNLLYGAFGLLHYSNPVPGFQEFLAGLHPCRTPEDMFKDGFWKATFQCTWPHRNTTLAEGDQFCSGTESMRGQELPFQEVSQSDVAYMAVYSIAHALHNLLACEDRDGTCADPGRFQPWQLLHSLRKVHFKTPDGSEILFDADGDLVTQFDIVWWQKTSEGTFYPMHIGKIDPRVSSGNRMSIHLPEDVQVRGLVPGSVCSGSCLPGFIQTPKQGAPHCCFHCSPCPEGQFTYQTDMKQCLLCPEDQYSSPTGDSCLPKTEAFLTFDEPLGFSLAVLSLMLAGLAVLVLGIFWKHQDSPVVKANNRPLSYLLLVSLSLCALCALLFLGQPTAATCLLRQTTFAVVFTVAVSSILAKTLTVMLAFRVTRPRDMFHVCLGPSVSPCVVLMSSMVQVMLCAVWLGTSPPFLGRDMASEPRHIVIQCQEGSGVAFYCVLGYLGFLAMGTFCVAFLARGLPDAFNETQFITFSMLLFCSVWIAFLPLYHSARGKSMVAVEIFSILASTGGLLGGIFLPKCYIILLKPERNTLTWLRQGH
ncbi:extracellular calcium-sensing receptor-like [Perognathus longimembris pacificus]|uniref:extracellular calcium-sensing receptor-like n=1 Tax=Perognathus longimembris pacificus TaxID=214514 RepID=UPI00201975A9|nr:extracellular calcium-sensing receptor-like [Perognathus longimembris pacificus]